MTETPVRSAEPTNAETSIVRRLHNTLQVVREDEQRLKRILELRRLKRRAKKTVRVR